MSSYGKLPALLKQHSHSLLPQTEEWKKSLRPLLWPVLFSLNATFTSLASNLALALSDEHLLQRWKK